MSLIALVTWIVTAGVGLYLLSIWLIEYDREFQSVAATRLPPLVLTAHVLLALGGLFIWIGYVIVDQERLAWIAAGAVLLGATFGIFMAIRWVGVYRTTRDARRSLAELKAGRLTLVGGPGDISTLELARDLGPPERNFPLMAVIAHGAFAVTTLTLVVLTVLGVFAT
jgi:manganese efflux pump family protein